SMVLIRPDTIRVKNFQDAARFAPRIAILPLFPFHQLADLHSLLNVIACIRRRLAARQAFVPLKRFRLCIKLRNNVHFFAAVIALHFLTSFILCPQHATHRTALCTGVLRPHFSYFNFRYMLSPPPLNLLASAPSFAAPPLLP